MQPISEDQKTIEFVLDVPGHNKDAIFSASKAWIAENFNSAKAITEDTDKDAARIIGNANIKYPRSSGFDCLSLARENDLLGFTLRIDAKDNKFKTTYSNLKIISLPTTGTSFGLIYTPGTPLSEYEIRYQCEINTAKQALQSLSGQLQKFILNETIRANW